MNLATISAVFALGALAACGGVPDETRVASYGDTAAPARSAPAISAKAPAQESASDAIAEARAAAAASAEPKEEKPGPGALAFSPAPKGDQTARADAPAPEAETAQVAALPKQAAEPASEDVAALPKKDEEPASEDAEAPAEPASEEVAALPKAEAQDPGRSYGVQLAAYRHASGAVAVWIGLLRAHPDLLAELSNTIRRADLGATRGVVHQLRVGPFAGEAEARTLCETLKKRGTDCFVVAPRKSGRP